MNKIRLSPLPRKHVMVPAALFLLVMLAVGSFADYPVSLTLYQGGNLPGRILAGFGIYPIVLAVAAAGAMLLAACSHKSLLTDICYWSGGGILIAAGAVLSAVLPPRYCNVPLWGTGIIGAVFVGATVFGILWLCRGVDKRMVLRVAAAFLLVVLADVLIVNVIKIPWGRPRMRLIAADARASFQPWWKPGTALRNTLTAAGIAAEEFKSFPSGHTANASALMLLTLLPLLRPSLARHQTALFLTGFAWTLLVAFSRVIMGAHFITDTAVGFCVGLFSLAAVCRLLFPSQKT